MTAPRARRFGRVNALGLSSLYRREIHRGFKIWGITLAAPALRSVLFAGVFTLVIRGVAQTMGGMPFLAFLLPGLVAAAVLERAFEATAFSLVYDKVEHIINDIVAAPLAPVEIVIAYALASATGALLAGLSVWLVLIPFGLGFPAAPLVTLYFAFGGAMMIALFGQLSGLWAAKWDHLSGVQTFVFMPVVFLSGVFFSLDRLTPTARLVAQFNPVFHVVDGIRYGFTGRADSDPLISALAVLAVDVLLFAAAYRLFARGYKLKA